MQFQPHKSPSSCQTNSILSTYKFQTKNQMTKYTTHQHHYLPHTSQPLDMNNIQICKRRFYCIRSYELGNGEHDKKKETIFSSWELKGLYRILNVAFMLTPDRKKFFLCFLKEMKGKGSGISCCEFFCLLHFFAVRVGIRQSVLLKKILIY